MVNVFLHFFFHILSIIYLHAIVTIKLLLAKIAFARYIAIMTSLSVIDPKEIEIAEARLTPYLNPTPLWSSDLLDSWLGHKLVFKIESFQKIGAFKYRGALNVLLKLKEQGKLPKEVVTFSSGNHAQAVALAARTLGIKATIYIAKYASPIKRQATISYGAEVIETESRSQAEQFVRRDEALGKYAIHPFDDDDIIIGQGTSCLEALRAWDDPERTSKPDAVFATCGGGGWMSGTYLAAKLIQPSIKVFAVEPLNANDAARSYRDGKIFSFDHSPETIADGARALCVSPRTFQYLQKVDGFYEVAEEDIIYWTQWLGHLLKIIVEPTSALVMGGVCQWLKTQKTPQNVLVMLSGGNVSPQSYRKIWEKNYLETPPSL
jgi:threonine dehydratase